MKYILHLFLILTLSVQSFAFITEWNSTTDGSRSGEEQFLNHHPFIGLFGAGVTSVSQLDARANLSAYLETCQNDAPSDVLNNTELKARFRSLIFDGTTNLLCVADSTYNAINTHDISVVLTPNGASSSVNIISNGDCNNPPSDIQIDTLYSEWIHSLTANENYDFNLADFEGVGYNTGFDDELLSFQNSYAQTTRFTTINNGQVTDQDAGFISLLHNIRPSEVSEITFEKSGSTTDHHTILSEDVARYVQLFLSTANVSLVRDNLENVATSYVTVDGIPVTDDIKKLDRAHQLLTLYLIVTIQIVFLALLTVELMVLGTTETPSFNLKHFV